MEIGTQLRKLRDKQRVPTREIAMKIGISQSTYTDWENGKTSPSLKLYFKIAQAFQISPVDFMSYLTGVVPDILSGEEKSSISELREMALYYQKYCRFLEEKNERLKAELATCKSGILLS